MELVKELEGCKIFKKRSGRFGVKDQAGKWLNTDAKVSILTKAGLIQAQAAPAKASEDAAEGTEQSDDTQGSEDSAAAGEENAEGSPEK